MKHIAGTLLLLLSAFTAAAQEVVINGTISGDLKGYQKLYFYSRTSRDSVMMENGKYTYRFPFKEPVVLNVFPEYVKNAGKVYVPFVVYFDQPAVFTITSDISKGMENSVVKGTETVELMGNYDRQKKAAWKKVSEELIRVFGKPWLPEQDPRSQEMETKREALSEQYLVPVLATLVEKHPDANAAAFILNSDGRTMLSVKDRERLYNRLSAKQKITKDGKAFYGFIQGLKKSAIGSTVSNFTLPDEKDESHALHEQKGKYILLDFWASWCAPCRKSFPRIREVYRQLKGENFEIISISIDKNKADWLKAVQEENNPWPQLLDNAGLSSSEFAVTGVPTSFLIGPDGKIMMREVGYDPNGGGLLEQKLESLFHKKFEVAAKNNASPGNNVIPAIKM